MACAKDAGAKNAGAKGAGAAGADRIAVSYGRDPAKAAREALLASGIGEALRPGMRAAIKPNLVVARPACEGATTHPEVAEGILSLLSDFGIRGACIMENSAVGGRASEAFRACGYAELSRRHGARLIDLEDSPRARVSSGGISFEVCAPALEADFIINAPVLKAHSQTLMTCCLKNLKGCIPQSEMRRFHRLGLHAPIAALAMAVKTGWCAVDGICGDLSFEEGGSPEQADRVIAGRCPVEVDSFCAALIGFAPEEIGYLSLAQSLGAGSFFPPGARPVELGREGRPRASARGSPAADRYRALIDEDAACSACHAALVFALARSGAAPAGRGKIRIGQGFRGKSGKGPGIGDCARGFPPCAPGCPPKALDILPLL